MRTVPLVFSLALVACASSQHRSPQPAPPLASTSAPEPSNASRAQLFDLRSNPWVNLHHVLLGKGAKRRGAHDDDAHPDGIPEVDVTVLEPRERAPWDAAVALYADTLSSRNVVADEELITLNQALSDHVSFDPLPRDRIATPIAETLERAMPVYRARWWPEHDRRNRAWMDRVRPEIASHGAALAAELARVLHAEWPSDALRVDVTSYAPPPGAAYTTFGPPHLTISGSDPRNQPPTALEILFHECSHLIIRPARDAISRELAAQHKSEPSLWHALLFYTAGWAVARRVPGHEPYADRERLYTDRWAAYRQAIHTHWRPYLEGRAELDAAIRAVVRAL